MPSKEKADLPLRGVCAFVSVANDDGTDPSKKYAEMLQDLGAKICNSRLAGMTHMIFRNGDEDKLAIAHQKNVQVVKPQWVDQCRDFLLRVPEDEFLVQENPAAAASSIGEKKRSSKGRKSMETTSNQARLLASPGDPTFSSSQAEGSAKPQRKRERKVVKAQPVAAQRVTRSSPVSSPAPSGTPNSELRRSNRAKGRLESDPKSDARKTRCTSTGTAKDDSPLRGQSQPDGEEVVKEQPIVAETVLESPRLSLPAPAEVLNSELRRSSRGKGLESSSKSTGKNRRSSTETVKSDATLMEDSPSAEKVNQELLEFMNQNGSVSSASKKTPSTGGKCESKPLSEAMLEKNWGSGNKKRRQAPRNSTGTLVEEGETLEVVDQYLKSPENEGGGGVNAHRTPMIKSPSTDHPGEKQGKVQKISIGKPQEVVLKDMGRGKWSCKACTVMNNGRAQKCIECNTVKGEERPREVMGDFAAQTIGGAAKPEKATEEVGKGRKKGDAPRKPTPQEEMEKVSRVSTSAPQTLEEFDAEMADTQQSRGKKGKKESKSQRKAPAKAGQATKKNAGTRKKTMQQEEDTDDMVISDDSELEDIPEKVTAIGKKKENKRGKKGSAKTTNTDKENKAPKRARRAQDASKDACEGPDEDDIGKAKKKSKVEEEKKAPEPEQADKNSGAPTILIVLSSFSPEKKEELLKLTRTLIKRVEAKNAGTVEEGKAVVVRLINSEDATADCTHLVLPSGHRKRTLKLLFAVARERYILTEDWLEACAERGEWLSEKEFELERFRTARPPTLKQTGSILRDETIYVGPTIDPDTKTIKKLVQAAGGRICQTLRSATLCVGQREPCKTWIKQEMEKSTSCQTLNTLIQKSAIVDTTWLYDAIENRQKPIDKSKYELGRRLMH